MAFDRILTTHVGSLIRPPRLVEHLRKSGHLFHANKFMHSYPHDWRSKRPTIFRATEGNPKDPEQRMRDFWLPAFYMLREAKMPTIAKLDPIRQGHRCIEMGRLDQRAVGQTYL